MLLQIPNASSRLCVEWMNLPRDIRGRGVVEVVAQNHRQIYSRCAFYRKKQVRSSFMAVCKGDWERVSESIEKKTLNERAPENNQSRKCSLKSETLDHLIFSCIAMLLFFLSWFEILYLSMLIIFSDLFNSGQSFCFSASACHFSWAVCKCRQSVRSTFANSFMWYIFVLSLLCQPKCSIDCKRHDWRKVVID